MLDSVRLLNEADLEQLRTLISVHPLPSRRQLSINLVQAWNWRSPTGQLKDMAANSLLLKPEQLGLITLR